ncbi:MAG: hypothetical protein IID36_06125 [Planctomycetes bacterium]|nr:hypothetical protein [Planctomycetota bacterium]
MTFLMQQNLRDFYHQFSRGFRGDGSIVGGVWAFVAIGAVVFFAYWATKRQSRRAATTIVNDPRGLFHKLLAGLPLSPTQRRMLRTVAVGLRLDNPAVILFSPKLYREHTARWRQGDAATGSPSHDRGADAIIEDTARVLFPEPGSRQVPSRRKTVRR